MNHTAHKVSPPKGFKGRYWKDKDGVFTKGKYGDYYNVSESKDFSMYAELGEVTVVGKAKRSALDKIVTGLSLSFEAKEGILEYAKKTGGDLGKTGNIYLKATKF